jgi:hypothetical protein
VRPAPARGPPSRRRLASLPRKAVYCAALAVLWRGGRIGEALEPLAEQARAEGWHEPVVEEIVELASLRARCLGYEVEY